MLFDEEEFRRWLDQADEWIRFITATYGAIAEEHENDDA